MTGMSLSEWHSGYRAFSVAALAHVPFEANSDGFDFDTEVPSSRLPQTASSRWRSRPTTATRSCYVDGLYVPAMWRPTSCATASPASASARRSRAPSRRSTRKPDLGSSHAQLLEILLDRSPGRVLDLGCGSGRLGAELKARGHHVVGVDVHETADAKERLDHFVVADLEQGIPLAVHEHVPYDTVVAADVLEHVSQDACSSSCAPCSPMALSCWPACRTSATGTHACVVSGRFDYDACGILDRRPRALLHPSQLRPAGSAQRVADHGHSTDRALFDVVERGAPVRRPGCATPSAGSTGPASARGRRCSPTNAHARAADHYSVEMACRTFMFDAL